MADICKTGCLEIPRFVISGAFYIIVLSSSQTALAPSVSDGTGSRNRSEKREEALMSFSFQLKKLD